MQRVFSKIVVTLLISGALPALLSAMSNNLVAPDTFTPESLARQVRPQGFVDRWFRWPAISVEDALIYASKHFNERQQYEFFLHALSNRGSTNGCDHHGFFEASRYPITHTLFTSSKIKLTPELVRAYFNVEAEHGGSTANVVDNLIKTKIIPRQQLDLWAEILRMPSYHYILNPSEYKNYHHKDDCGKQLGALGYGNMQHWHSSNNVFRSGDKQNNHAIRFVQLFLQNIANASEDKISVLSAAFCHPRSFKECRHGLQTLRVLLNPDIKLKELAVSWNIPPHLNGTSTRDSIKPIQRLCNLLCFANNYPCNGKSMNGFIFAYEQLSRKLLNSNSGALQKKLADDLEKLTSDNQKLEKIIEALWELPAEYQKLTTDTPQGTVQEIVLDLKKVLKDGQEKPASVNQKLETMTNDLQGIVNKYENPTVDTSQDAVRKILLDLAVTILCGVCPFEASQGRNTVGCNHHDLVWFLRSFFELLDNRQLFGLEQLFEIMLEDEDSLSQSTLNDIRNFAFTLACSLQEMDWEPTPEQISMLEAKATERLTVPREQHEATRKNLKMLQATLWKKVIQWKKFEYVPFLMWNQGHQPITLAEWLWIVRPEKEAQYTKCIKEIDGIWFTVAQKLPEAMSAGMQKVLTNTTEVHDMTIEKFEEHARPVVKELRSMFLAAKNDPTTLEKIREDNKRLGQAILYYGVERGPGVEDTLTCDTGTTSHLVRALYDIAHGTKINRGIITQPGLPKEVGLGYEIVNHVYSLELPGTDA